MSWLDPTIPILNIFKENGCGWKRAQELGLGGGKAKPLSIVPGGCGGAAAGRAGNFWVHVRRLKSLNGTGLVSVMLLAFPTALRKVGSSESGIKMNGEISLQREKV